MELKNSRLELIRAEKAIQKLKASSSLEEFEDIWRDFLNYLEKCWIKAERECQPFKDKFLPFQGKFKNLRKNDPLLKYLKNARDADVHSIQEIIDKRKSELQSIRLYPNKPTFIKELVIKDGQVEKYDGDPVIFEFTPDFVRTKVFTNNGITFTVPLYHRGQKIKNPYDPTELAFLGVRFYKDFLEQIENKF